MSADEATVDILVLSVPQIITAQPQSLACHTPNTEQCHAACNIAITFILNRGSFHFYVISYFKN
jgi:hypothetical protein